LRISVADNPDIRRSKLMGWPYSIITGGRSGNIQSIQIKQTPPSFGLGQWLLMY
jgi:hypothetical protein